MGNQYSDLSYLHLNGALTQAQKDVTLDDLEAAATSKVLQADEIKSPVIIESMELLFNNGLYFLRTRSKDGSVGVSVASERAEYLHPLLKQLIIPFFIGKDARDLEALLDGVYVYENNYKLSGLALWCCISWVEASLLDLLGQISGKSVGDLLGGVIRNEVPIYVASGNRGTTPEEEIAVLQEKVADTGAKAIKFKVGGRMSKNTDSIHGRSESLIYMTRKIFGDEMSIHADGNGSYDPPMAIEYGKMLEEINAFFYEEPCPFEHLEDTKEVADALRIPMAFGEQETSMRRFRWIIANDAAQVVQPDLQYNGGFIRNTRIARMAALKGIPVTPHISSGYGYVYVLHFASYIPNIGKFQENKTGVKDTRFLFSPQMEVKDGVINAPTGPGLGMDDSVVTSVLRKAYTV
ncbi:MULTISPECIES: mandelate racemase/muconate lactonizing enzyme family protein [Paenibacillus]|uniref:Mandelate racemase/muconate lactonizing enzyme family protein n=1 Tax=Paenibacillus radicis (ex Xue et al. 2023) TaxID=2972489 RepID=A0ABT1YN95_9BACL|nr:mandelate racemase/muconate lactonizing enzyme family protein [Paenibacillus radicis (ex Xue et al. 2023)]MCR8634644.1 mandelate racemase/muconate lactonizing enzyme family protein [Paenibacillus radicis (ex Xue et al. 2023)]